MIQLTYPWALLSLVSIPVLLALHSLRPTRRTVVLSTTSLWREALRDRQRGLGLQKLLRDLSLLVLLLFACVASLGLADPRWLTRTAQSGDAVLILDVSASMQARDVAPTRFDRAKREAADLIDALAEGGRMLIMTSGRNAVLRSAFESNTQTLREALSKLEPTDEAGRPREALELALALLRGRERSRVYFLTDAAFDEGMNFAGPSIEHRIFAGSGRNVAITRFDVRPDVGATDRFQMLLTVKNYTDAQVTVPATVFLDDAELVRRSFSLPPRGDRTLVLPFRGRAAGRARVEIDYDDDLAADNQAFAVMGADEALRVLLVTTGNFYLETVLEALPNVFVTRRDEVQGERLARDAQLHDLVVLDRVSAPILPPGRYLLIDTVAPGLPFTAAGSVDHPAIEGAGASALLRHVDLTGVKIDRARRVVIDDDAPGVQRLFWSGETELALALIADDVRAVFLGFDLARSSFPLHAAFPLFVKQSLAWLRPRGSRFSSTQSPAGEPYSLQVPAKQTELIVRTPSRDGSVYDVDDGVVRLDATSQSGIYRYTLEHTFGDVHRYFAVNLTDERESDLAPRAELSGERSAVAEPHAKGQVTIALWPYLAAIAMALLTLEWCLWGGRRRGA